MFKYDTAPFVKSNAVKQVELFLDLTKEQQETFMILLIGWQGTVDELIDASTLL